MSCQTIYAIVSSFLSEEREADRCGPELGHIVLHPEAA